MSIQFVTIRCPECGADLQIEEGRPHAFCTYCGAKVIIANDNEHIYRTIDEAGVKHAETERILRLRELELEEKEKLRSRKGILVAYAVALLFVIVGAIICIFSYAGAFGILIGLYIGMFAFFKSDDQEKPRRKRKYQNPYDVAITDAMVWCSDKNYKSAAMMFESAGFTNVKAVPLKDLGVFNQRKDGLVDLITINGDEEFEEGDIYPKDANILITYHSCK